MGARGRIYPAIIYKMIDKTERPAQPEEKNEATKTEFKSSFKTWIRVVAFVVSAVFIPEQAAQAVEYDWRVLWQKPAVGSTFTPGYLKDIGQIDIPLSIRNILKDIAGKPINAVQISPTLTVKLEKPLNISAQRIEEIYNWLKGKPCGSKALYDFLNYKGAAVAEQDIAVMALTVDILNGVVKPEGSPKVIRNSLYALSRTSEFFDHKLYPVEIEDRFLLGAVPAPFIAHLKNDHYVLVTRVTDGKVYYSDEHKEKFLPLKKFLERFSGYALVSSLSDNVIVLSDIVAKAVLGAGWSGDSNTSGSWAGEDGNSNYTANNYKVPQGSSIPHVSSFTDTNITPTYYFPRDM